MASKEKATVRDNPFEGLPPLKLDDAITIGLQTRTPILALGDPGIGKTSKVKSYCKRRGIELIIVQLGLRDYQDVMGWPFKDPNATFVYQESEFQIMRFAPPDWAAKAAQLSGAHKKVLILFDDVTNASPSTVKLVHRLWDEYNLGDYLQLDPQWCGILAAGNPPDSGTDATDLSPPVANRIGHADARLVKVDVDRNDFVNGFPSYWGASEEELKLRVGQFGDLKETAVSIQSDIYARSMVASFARNKGTVDAIYSLPKTRSERSKAWLSLRSLDRASRALACVLSAGLLPVEAVSHMALFTGPAWAREFLTFVRHWDLPDPDTLLADPEALDMSKFRGDQLYCMVDSVANVAVHSNNAATFLNAWKFHKHVLTAGHGDIATNGAVRMATYFADNRKTLPDMVKLAPYITPFAPTLQAAGMMPGSSAAKRKVS
jgi:hypothetical protein